MAAQFTGKWKVTTTENTKEFFKALGFSDEVIKEGAPQDDINNNLIDEIALTATDCTVTSYVKDKVVSKHVYTLGSEMDQSEGGKTFKVKMFLDGDALKVEQKGDGFSAVYTRTVSGGEMTLMMTSDKNVTSKRILKKL